MTLEEKNSTLTLPQAVSDELALREAHLRRVRGGLPTETTPRPNASWTPSWLTAGKAAKGGDSLNAEGCEPTLRGAQ